MQGWSRGFASKVTGAPSGPTKRASGWHARAGFHRPFSLPATTRALGLIRAFTENGIRVPDDVSIVGFDDVEGSDYFLPPLTTVRQDFTALALMSTEVLIGAMEGRDVDRTPIPPTLVVRNSARQATSRK
jgi:hypothetical protein